MSPIVRETASSVLAGIRTAMWAARVERTQMADLVLVLVLLAFLGLCALYIRGCERIIRSDEIGDSIVELTRHGAER